MEHTERPRAMRSRDDYIINFVAYFLCSLVLIATLYPLIYVVSASFSEPSEVINGNIWLLPKNVTLDGYEMILDYDPIWIGYRNTIFYTVFGTAFNLLLTLPCAYSLSRRDFRGRKGIMLLFTFTMFFSGGMIPTYLNMKSLHLTGSLWGLILPFMISVYNMIILKTSFASIPESLIEAARIDGASHLKVLFSIVLPLSKAILAVMVLYYGVGVWNGWFWASAILRDREMYPLQLVLREILLQNSTSNMTGGTGVADVESVAATVKYATIMVATVPILCIYPFLQKYFAAGVMVGAVKE